MAKNKSPKTKKGSSKKGSKASKSKAATTQKSKESGGYALNGLNGLGGGLVGSLVGAVVILGAAYAGYRYGKDHYAESITKTLEVADKNSPETSKQIKETLLKNLNGFELRTLSIELEKAKNDPKSFSEKGVELLKKAGFGTPSTDTLKSE